MAAPVAPSRRSTGGPAAALFAKLSIGGSGAQQHSIEAKMAQLRAAYASPAPPQRCGLSARNGHTRASLPTACSVDKTAKERLSPIPRHRSSTTDSPRPSISQSRRGSALSTHMAPRPAQPSLMELAASAGLLALSPSDLVFESSVLGIAYYDFVLSVSQVPPSPVDPPIGIGATRSAHASPAHKRPVHGTGSEPSAADQERQQNAKLMRLVQQSQRHNGTPTEDHKGDGTTAAEATEADGTSSAVYRLFLAKLDAHTNVEWFESVLVPSALLESNGIPVTVLALLTMGILVWRGRLAQARLLCLANAQLSTGDEATAALEALKRAAAKYKCAHHVLTVGQRRQSAASTHSSCSSSSFRSSSSSGSLQAQDPGMKLRVLMCQSRHELAALPAQALRDTKFLLAPSSNPLLCLCFPLT